MQFVKLQNILLEIVCVCVCDGRAYIVKIKERMNFVLRCAAMFCFLCDERWEEWLENELLCIEWFRRVHFVSVDGIMVVC